MGIAPPPARLPWVDGQPYLELEPPSYSPPYTVHPRPPPQYAVVPAGIRGGARGRAAARGIVRGRGRGTLTVVPGSSTPQPTHISGDNFTADELQSGRRIARALAEFTYRQWIYRYEHDIYQARTTRTDIDRVMMEWKVPGNELLDQLAAEYPSAVQDINHPMHGRITALQGALERGSQQWIEQENYLKNLIREKDALLKKEDETLRSAQVWAAFFNKALLDRTGEPAAEEPYPQPGIPVPVPDADIVFLQRLKDKVVVI